MNFQTRSETTGLNYFNTLAEALKAAEKDDTIWKISFSISENRGASAIYYSVPPERVVLESVDGKWVLRQ